MTQHLLEKYYSFATEEDMQAFAARLACQTPKQCVIYLQGELGAGKTTFTRGFLQGLGYQGKVKSPTYALVEPYELGQQTVFHFDLYRLRDPQEAAFFGIDDYFAQEAIALIEWPDKGVPLLPPPDLTCYILIADTGRDIRLEANTARGQLVLQHF